MVLSDPRHHLTNSSPITYNISRVEVVLLRGTFRGTAANPWLRQFTFAILYWGIQVHD